MQTQIESGNFKCKQNPETPREACDASAQLKDSEAYSSPCLKVSRSTKAPSVHQGAAHALVWSQTCLQGA
eukprot:4180442-Amphidinium_carterae.2